MLFSRGQGVLFFLIFLSCTVPAQARLNLGVVPRAGSLISDQENAQHFSQALEDALGEEVHLRFFSDEDKLVDWMHRFREIDLGLLSRRTLKRQPAGRFFSIGQSEDVGIFVIRQGIASVRRQQVLEAITSSLQQQSESEGERTNAPVAETLPDNKAPATSAAPEGALPSPALLSPRQEENRLKAVALARKGSFKEALAIFADLHRQVPGNLQLNYDYLTVLSWAEHDAEVVILADRVPLDHAPRYVVEAVAKALRNQKWFEESAALYQRALSRFPEHLPLAIGRAHALADAGLVAEAVSLVDELKSQYPRRREVLLASLYVAGRGSDHIAALDASQRLLELDPQDSRALLAQVRALEKLGASHLAADYAEDVPGELFRLWDWQRLRNNLAAHRVRWGRYPPIGEDKRFVEIDLALASIEENLERLDAGAPKQKALILQARIDRMVALRDRYRMQEAVAEYRNLVQSGAPIPPYGLKAAGDAFLYLEQPEMARAIYLRALEADSGDFDLRLALFYAYVELEDFSRALNLVDDLSNDASVQRSSQRDPRYASHPNRLAADMAAALARIFAGYLPEAQRRLEALHDPAPMNPDLKRELGGLYASRGWPRRAQETIRGGLLYDPAHRGLQIALAQTHLDLREFRQAGALIDNLRRRFPEDKQVRRLQELWENHTRRELHVAVSYSDSTGTDPAADELRLSSIVHSRPFRVNYRAFAGIHWSKADFPEGQGIYRRYSAGLAYRSRNFEGTATVSFNESEAEGPGVGLAGTWFAGDHWAFPIALEIFSGETPVRALRNGIDANAARAGAILRESERRRWSLEGSIMDFSDGNLRAALSGNVRQRLVTRPHYRLEGGVVLYASANDRSDVSYFSPERDYSLALALDNEWMLWRRYRDSFSHRLSLTGGLYHQKGYGSSPLVSVAYEHLWQAGYRFDLVYGAGLHRRTFDGEAETGTDYYLRLLWKF